MTLYTLDAMRKDLVAPGGEPGCCILAIAYRDGREVGRTWLRDRTIALHPPAADLAHAPDRIPERFVLDSVGEDDGSYFINRATVTDGITEALVKLGGEDVAALYNCRLRVATPATMGELLDLALPEAEREARIARADLPLLARALHRTGRIFHRRRSGAPAVYWAEPGADGRTPEVRGEEYLGLMVPDAEGRRGPAGDDEEARRLGARPASSVPVPELD